MPIALELPQDRSLFVEFLRKAGGELRRVVVLIGIEGVPISERHDVPCQGLVDLEIGPDTKHIVREFGIGVVAPVLPNPSTARDRKDARERQAIAECPFEILARFGDEGAGAKSLRPASLHSAAASEFLLDFLLTTINRRTRELMLT